MKEKRLLPENISIISILLALPLKAKNGTANFAIKGVALNT